MVQLFGSYQGTVRDPGLQWVNPFTKRRRVSTRIRNHETPLAKVNDADGNPIEIAAVVVWQVEDTAKALYAVDDFVQFVATQTETAVRHIATSYAYEVHGSGMLSLRDNADEITQQLSAEIQARVASAGVKIIESRLTRLSYASEIAQAMLRRQAASRRGRRAAGDRGGGGRHGQAGPDPARGGRRRGTRRGAQGRDGLQPAGSALQRTGHPAGRQYGIPVPVVAERKGILLRLDPAVHDALARWAADELRSTNAQIEFLLRRALTEAGRMPDRAARMRGRGRPRKDEALAEEAIPAEEVPAE